MEWCWIQDYENIYKIYKNGDIEKYYKNGNTLILKPTKHKKTGYLIVNLFKKGKRKLFSIHRLIGIHFIPNPENKPNIDHIDGDKLNNSISNLRWVSHQENNLNTKNRGKYKRGVSFIKDVKKFRAQIQINGKRIYLGEYETEDEAAESYRLKFIEAHGFEPCAR